MKLTPQQFVLLEKSYFKYFPTHIPDEIFQDYKTTLEYKELIRFTKPDKRILNHLITMVIDKIQRNQRFQKITFIKLIRLQCDRTFIDSEISEKLFFIFKSLINEVNETIASHLNGTIIDIKLAQKNIDWLIENYTVSEHIQNRLLRYPKANKAITNWSIERLMNNDLNNRLSELIGLQLNFNPDFNFTDKTSLIWGIHYSKLPNSKKKELLLKHLTTDNFVELIKICEKNDFTDVISQLYKEFDK